MSGYLDKKYINLVSTSLEKFKWKKSNLANCRCPICGDSETNLSKARGYFFQNDNTYFFKCHNCGVSFNIYKFLELVSPTLYKEYCLEKFKDQKEEKPVETVATYISAGVALPQVLGFGAPIISSLLNSVVHSLGYDTPSRLLLPGGASAIGFSTALDGLSGMRSIFQSFVTDQPVDQSAVSDALAFSSYAGLPSVLIRLGHSVSKTEQTGLAGQSADRRGSQGFFYKPEAELYRDAERYPYVPSEPGFGPVEKFRAEPFTIPKNTVAQPGMPASPQSPATGQMPVAGEQPPAAPPSQLEPGSSLFQEDVQTTPGSLFDQR